jgi:hypothetical protein
MKYLSTTIYSLLIASAALIAGCGHKEGDGHDHGAKEEAHGKDDGHGHGEESPSGASFKPGKGVILVDETRKILGVEVADVEERKLPGQVEFTAQVFGTTHNHGSDSNDHSACLVRGTGLVSTNMASVVAPGQSVELLQGSAEAIRGKVLSIQKGLALGESEIVVGFSSAAQNIQFGEFIPARILLSRDASVTAVPSTALLRTAEGTFVYTVNGDAFFRTQVKTGAETDGWAEITDGLLAGDQVATKAVQTLWLIELRATKGGGHSH